TTLQTNNTLTEFQALHTNTQNLFQELDPLIHLLMYADHRDLHSFPTRRSSDLFRSFPMPLQPDAILDASGLHCPEPVMMLHNKRSEEHTSELQSRENLVCRLLLEKKKQTIRKNLFHTREWFIRLLMYAHHYGPK